MVINLSPDWMQVSLLAVEPIVMARSHRKKTDEQKNKINRDKLTASLGSFRNYFEYLASKANYVLLFNFKII